MAPSRKSIAASLLQTQGESSDRDKNVFIIQTAHSFVAVIEAQERDKVWDRESL